ncbi:MAG TPA: iron ABC transporter permease [Fibrobacteraceae bacterium]|nr:iron ABC transporter permease [Fibrobacter sp.]HPW94942.1 iron ABC transporter permease [Fibrobacteraceae bacterium]
MSLYLRLFFLLTLVVLLSGLTMILGPASFSFKDLFFSSELDPFALNVLFELRLPRVFAAVFAGTALSVAGLSLQSVFRNPLAGPYVLGISSGASLGVALVLLAGFSFGSLGFFPAAALGAFAVTFLVLMFSRLFENSAMLLVVGLMISYIVDACITLLMHFSEAEALRSYVAWGMGSFSRLTVDGFLAFFIAVVLGLSFILFSMRYLNAVRLGDDFVKGLGLSVRLYQTLVLLGTSILTAATTVFCGPIAFLGLAVPHIAFALFKTSNHRILIPASILIGINLSLCVGLLPQIPLNAMMSLFGVPVVFWVLFSSRYKRKGDTYG